MDREDIIRMARNEYGIYAFTADSLTEFANLVAAAEREACAKVCDEKEEIFRKYYTTGLLALCASAIRARGDKE